MQVINQICNLLNIELMKNYFRKSFTIILMVLACFSFAFVACGDEEDDKGNGGQQNSAAQQTGLVGTWKGKYDDKYGNYYDYDNEYITICFNADYTGWGIYDGDEKEPFTWYTEGNKLTFIYYDEQGVYDEEDSYIYKVAGNQLYLYDFDSQTGEQELDIVLTRQ